MDLRFVSPDQMQNSIAETAFGRSFCLWPKLAQLDQGQKSEASGDDAGHEGRISDHPDHPQGRPRRPVDGSCDAPAVLARRTVRSLTPISSAICRFDNVKFTKQDADLFA
jgi:hypothetical protein